MNTTKESYQDYFFQQQQLFHELQDAFHQSQSRWLYQDMSEQIHWQSRGIQDILEEQQQEMNKQSKELDDKLNSLYWQEKRSLNEREEEKHEH